ncbi:MAG: 50S ribosomal protein L32 [Candidatus Moranbacteria bacterium GW2011_GWE2_35_2-]|nr:MAG: 50S ribosomal protein L32 [Candidatus Moranbacteria bacterium GW2011_GWE2_35_2-]KKQ22112.1 MAG: 50S ribosomal protein L32 [Candidatus Moranbacteria bacterium GW2011_GWF2_37_11]KKQ29136.1 MAG: 50S ribosomal protein L32 [Candidatus Moranbacteria bacterium GW2011_GWD1_37_17]KKQ31121.1 MAG: 50S ribosomal protein L32 [Candidatus Moranbacteria bacterium GW2011_GWE1_37_24]HBO16481.1 50S ribosomal protein L32 [Candidatus Moranbacteria bacterium]
MPVPKQRHNKARQGRRRAGQLQAVGIKKTQKCPKCGATVMPHRACAKCGYYKGNEIVNTLKKKKKQ